MLAGGAVAGAMLWRYLMLEPPREGILGLSVSEPLSQQDRQALDRLLSQRGSR
jgi:hypothetical protein